MFFCRLRVNNLRFCCLHFKCSFCFSRPRVQSCQMSYESDEEFYLEPMCFALRHRSQSPLPPPINKQLTANTELAVEYLHLFQCSEPEITTRVLLSHNLDPKQMIKMLLVSDSVIPVCFLHFWIWQFCFMHFWIMWPLPFCTQTADDAKVAGVGHSTFCRHPEGWGSPSGVICLRFDSFMHMASNDFESVVHFIFHLSSVITSEVLCWWRFGNFLEGVWQTPSFEVAWLVNNSVAQALLPSNPVLVHLLGLPMTTSRQRSGIWQRIGL